MNVVLTLSVTYRLRGDGLVRYFKGRREWTIEKNMYKIIHDINIKNIDIFILAEIQCIDTSGHHTMLCLDYNYLLI